MPRAASLLLKSSTLSEWQGWLHVLSFLLTKEFLLIFQTESMNISKAIFCVQSLFTDFIKLNNKM